MVRVCERPPTPDVTAARTLVALHTMPSALGVHIRRTGVPSTASPRAATCRPESWAKAGEIVDTSSASATGPIRPIRDIEGGPPYFLLGRFCALPPQQTSHRAER